MKHIDLMSAACASTPTVSLASAVQKLLLAASLGVGLMSVGVAPAHAATNVAIKDFQGAWSSTTAYTAGAVVTYNNASYIALVSSTAVTPGTNASKWDLLDAPGAKGATGATGPAGISYGVNGKQAGIVTVGSQGESGFLVASSAAVSESGTYYVTANAQATVFPEDQVTCFVGSAPNGPLDPNTIVDDGFDGTLANDNPGVGPSSPALTATITVSDVFTVKKGDVVNLYCKTYLGGNPVGPAVLTAILINNSKP